MSERCKITSSLFPSPPPSPRTKLKKDVGNGHSSLPLPSRSLLNIKEGELFPPGRNKKSRKGKGKKEGVKDLDKIQPDKGTVCAARERATGKRKEESRKRKETSSSSTYSILISFSCASFLFCAVAVRNFLSRKPVHFRGPSNLLLSLLLETGYTHKMIY